MEKLTEELSKLTVVAKPIVVKKKRNYPVYWCIKFTAQDVHEHIAKIPTEDIAHLKKQEAFHITLLFNRSVPSEETIKQYNELVNTSVDIKITGHVIDDKGCAFVIDKSFTHHELCTNKHPHISVGNTSDVKPVYNNTLLEKVFGETPDSTHKHVKYDEPIIITGVISAF